MKRRDAGRLLGEGDLVGTEPHLDEPDRRHGGEISLVHGDVVKGGRLATAGQPPWRQHVELGSRNARLLASLSVAVIPRLAVRDLPAARCPIIHIFDLIRILRRGCRHEAGHGASAFVSVGLDPNEELDGDIGAALALSRAGMVSINAIAVRNFFMTHLLFIAGTLSGFLARTLANGRSLAVNTEMGLGDDWISYISGLIGSPNSVSC
jgi:hypothetical protein